MALKINDVVEVTLYDRNKGFYRAKKVYFDVNGSEHTLIVSMKDFNEGKTRALVEAEYKKIVEILKK